MKLFSEWIVDNHPEFYENLEFMPLDSGLSREKTGLSRRSAAYQRTDISDEDAKRMAVSIGDIVDLGPEVSKNQIAKIVEVRNSTVKVINLYNQRLTIIPIDELYLKRDLMGRELIPRDQQQLNAMGAKNLWIKLSERQYKKFASQYKEKEIEDVISKQKEIDQKQIDKLRSWFAAASKEESNPREEDGRLKDIFKSEQPSQSSGPAPLSRYVKKKELP
jgi:hypothetical protein